MHVIFTGLFGGPFLRGDSATVHRGEEHYLCHNVVNVSTYASRHSDEHTSHVECTCVEHLGKAEGGGKDACKVIRL